MQLGIGGAAVAAAALWLKRSPAETISLAERVAMQSVAEAFMRKFDVPGLSVAISRQGALVYNEAFGLADREQHQPLSTSSLFRIASVSKPITAVGIFTLIEKGKISLQDNVFGTGGILGDDYGTQPYKPYVREVSVDHLLTHSAGGWPNDASDPMFQNPQMSHAELISWTLDNLPLQYPPGEHYAYSNFGYCVLGRIVEKVTQVPYEEYIRQEVLRPCGIEQMRIAANTLDERAPNEVIYYAQSGEDPYWMNIRRMDSNGGWLANASDLVQFAVNIGGIERQPGVLRPDSIRTMVTPGPANPPSDIKYARGWNVRDNGRGNWWHVGSLPGTTSVLVRTARGFCWSALINTRRQPADQINMAFDQMVWEMARQVKGWRP